MKMVRIKTDVAGENDELALIIKNIEIVKLDCRKIEIITASDKLHTIEFETADSAEKYFKEFKKIINFQMKIVYIDSDAEVLCSGLLFNVERIESIRIDCRYIYITTLSGSTGSLEFEDIYVAEKKFEETIANLNTM